MKRGLLLTTPIILATLLASSLAASAQQPPSLRAAPPPDVLRAAPDAGTVAQEQRDVAGRWLGATDAAVQSFARAGGSLTNIVTGKFDGVSTAIAIADYAGPAGAASALDVRGAVSGAAAIAVGGKVTAGGAALFGEIGTVAGGAVGSFFPVIGNFAGSIVGGAVGTAAGGFICAFGYDKYVKDYVAKGVTGVMSVFDTAPLSEAMQAKRAFLWATMSPEQQAQLQTFKPEEVTLLDFGTLPYVVVPKQPLPNAQQAALPPAVGALLPEKLQFPTDYGPTNCTIASDQMRCAHSWSLGNSQWHMEFTGTVSGSTVTGTQVTIEDVRFQTAPCAYRWRWSYQMRYDFEDGGRVHVTATNGAINLVANSCPVPPKASLPPGYAGDATWVAVQ